MAGLLEAAKARYFARKDVADALAEAQRTTLSRTLGAKELTALGVGAIVGAGVFAVTGFVAAEYTGPAVVIAFAMVAVASALAAFAYAELASMIPLGGSAYTYAYASMGELVAWITGWCVILAYAIGNSAIASAFSDNLTGLAATFGYVVPDALTRVPDATGFGIDLPAFVVVLLVTFLLLRPVNESAGANLLMVVLKVGVLLVFIAVGATGIDPSNYTPFVTHGFGGILGGAALLFFAMVGFDAVSTAAEEARDPGKDLVKGILGSLLIVAILFIAVAFVLTGMVQSDRLATGEPLALAMREAGHPWLATLMNVGAVLATLTVLFAFQLASTRVVLTLARDGLLPSWLAWVHPKHATPNRVTLALGVLVGLGAAVIPFGLLLEVSTAATIALLMVVMLAVIVLRKTAPDAPRPFRAPLVPWLPAIGFLACGVMMLNLNPVTLWGFLAWLGLGTMIYAAYGAGRSRLRQVKVAAAHDRREIEKSTTFAEVPREP